MPTRHEQYGYAQALRAANFLKRRSKPFPRVGIVLGSGFGELASRLANPVTIPYSQVPHFPRPAVEGHAGQLHLGRWKKVPVAVLAGRVHLYEGYTPAEVAFGVRVLGLAGVETLLLTCAAGGIAPAADVGSLMVFSDHLNLLGSSPLSGPHDKRWGERFVDMSRVYDARLRSAALKAAGSLPLKCFEGVYAAVPGPQFETPAEIRALKRLGADAVGMSTVPEVIAARQLNVRVLAIALISNRAAGLAREPLRHGEVLAAGNRGAKVLAHLLDRLLPRLAS
ncbi:MAG TPA: purine-nucleoside phosphorylase [Terriglobia bacterium]|nr:purine-nucleoside phosphorylase [Terriglobia bacterium]